jgi:ketosteroid isomerase-like protein
LYGKVIDNHRWSLEGDVPDAVDVVRRFTDAALAGDGETAMGLIGPDCVFEEAESLPYGGDHIGPVGIGAMLGDLFRIYDLVPEAVKLTDCGSFVLARAAATFTARTTGRQLRMPIVELYEVSDGHIQRNQIFYQDTKALLDLLT